MMAMQMVSFFNNYSNHNIRLYKKTSKLKLVKELIVFFNQDGFRDVLMNFLFQKIFI